MRVITCYISNSPIGGASRRYLELIQGMLDRGWEVHDVSPRGLSAIEHPRLVHHRILAIPFRPSVVPFLLQVFFTMLWLGRRRHFHAVVTFSLFDGLLAIGYRAVHSKTRAILCDRASALTGFAILNRGRPWARIILAAMKAVERLTYRRADLVIFNSEHRRDEVARHVPLDSRRVKVIYNNANPTWVGQQNGARPPVLPPGKRIIGFVGNLYLEGRDLGTLVRAFALAHREIPNTALVMVGTGPDRGRVEALVRKLDLDEHVVLAGWQDNPLSWMRTFDLLVVTALHESFSNTILEALYCGALVIGSRVGGIPEALKHDELMFPPQNVDALAARIVELLTSGSARERALQLIQARRQAFLFDWQDEMARAIAEAIG